MSKVMIAALVLTFGLCSASFAAQAYSVSGSGYNYDPFESTVPSGLRFGGNDITVRTGDTEGAPAAGAVAGPCCGGPGGCGGIGCLDWKLVSWFASWDDEPGYGYGRRCGRGCGF